MCLMYFIYIYLAWQDEKKCFTEAYPESHDWDIPETPRKFFVLFGPSLEGCGTI